MSWIDTTGDDFENHPGRFAFKFAGGLLFLGLLLGATGSVLGWFGESAQVLQEEVGPRALLVKYEWFKDVSAQLDKKQADISVYDQRLAGLEASYEGMPRKDWPRDDRQLQAQWESEVAGVKASYNSLAAEYNANMVKVHWAFCNAGDLPAGAAEALPREYKPYETR